MVSYRKGDSVWVRCKVQSDYQSDVERDVYLKYSGAAVFAKAVDVMIDVPFFAVGEHVMHSDHGSGTVVAKHDESDKLWVNFTVVGDRVVHAGDMSLHRGVDRDDLAEEPLAEQPIAEPPQMMAITDGDEGR